MKIRTSAALLAALLGLAAGSRILAADTESNLVERELTRVMADFKNAVEKVDLDAVLALAADAPEFRYMMPDGSVTDFAGWKQGHIDYFATVAAHRLTEKSQQITVLAPDTAQVTWLGTMDIVPKDGPEQRVDPFAATFLFKRLGSAWKLVHQHESGPPPQLVDSGSAAPAAFVHPPGEYITVDGAKLWVEQVGTGEPILLIAGGPGCSHSYLHADFASLAATHRTILFDALGTGKSDRAPIPADYTLDRAVDDVVGLLHELKLGPAVILGHSYGTVVAQALAIRHPELVKKLVLVSPVISAEAWRTLNVRFFEACAQHYPDEWAQLSALRDRGLRWSAPECRAISDKLEVWLKTDYFDASNDAKLAPLFVFENSVFEEMTGDGWEPDVTGTLAGFDFRPQLKNLRMPLLVMAGRWDGNTFPANTRQYRQFAPQAEFVMLERSGHHPFLEEPELALVTLRAFLAR